MCKQYICQMAIKLDNAQNGLIINEHSDNIPLEIRDNIFNSFRGMLSWLVIVILWWKIMVNAGYCGIGLYING